MIVLRMPIQRAADDDAGTVTAVAVVRPVTVQDVYRPRAVTASW